MLEPIPIDLAGQRPIPERTNAINAALAKLEEARPKHAPSTTRNPHARILRQLVASFKPPQRNLAVPPLHGMETGLGDEVERAPPALIPA